MGKVLIIKGADFSDNALVNNINVVFYAYGYATPKSQTDATFEYNIAYSLSKMLRVNGNTEITITKASTGAGCAYATYFNSSKQKIEEIGLNTTINTPTVLSIPANCKYVVINSRNHNFSSIPTEDPVAYATNLDGIEDWPVPIEEWRNYPSS